MAKEKTLKELQAEQEKAEHELKIAKQNIRILQHQATVTLVPVTIKTAPSEPGMGRSGMLHLLPRLSLKKEQRVRSSRIS